MSSQVVIKALPATPWRSGPYGPLRGRNKKMFKVVKLVNYDSVNLIDTIFTEDQVTQFLKLLNKRVSYEILGA